MVVIGERYFDSPCMKNFEPRIRELEEEGVLIYKKKEVYPEYITCCYTETDGVVMVIEKPLLLKHDD